MRLEQVSFSYPTRSGLVLDGLDLELAPGETVALVGESGAGKSTVAELLLGLIEPSSRASLRRRCRSPCVSIGRRGAGSSPGCPSTRRMFRGSVADNIRLGDPSASDRAVRDAAALAGADEFVCASAERLRDR